MLCCFSKPPTQTRPISTMAEPPAAESDTHPPTWQDLLGSNNWENLLDPLDLSLRNLILRCGDFCQATYDAFNNDQNSKYCGSSRYGKRAFFDKVMLENAGDYRVVAFLYATARVSVPEAFMLHSQSRESWDRESNWIGYVAATSDEASRALGRREVYVAWRGTTRNYEWVNVLGAKLTSVRSIAPALVKNSTNAGVDGSGGSSSSDDDEAEPKVMHGWMTIYTSSNENSPFAKTSARTQLASIIKSVVEKYKGENLSITLTGHSLGASLSVLSAFDLMQNGVVPATVPVTSIIFGCPQVGNEAFKTRLAAFPNLKTLHVRNVIDLIPHYPSRALGYVYVGTELVIDTRKSPSLKDSKNPSDWHNLQAMLHVVAGWGGAEGEFRLRVRRSVALVNKSAAYLAEELLVPGSWWVEKNKGMVRGEDGEWVLAPPCEEDLPVPEFDSFGQTFGVCLTV
uniref:Phospholipase A1 n=1 Tax=Kalanchoe fedtschenkoi TaxID=63787 RepID=A0A7N0RGH9_KALFE